MRFSTIFASLLLVMGLVATAAVAGEITIQVSPHTVVLERIGDCFTVHADIPFSTVDAATVTLNGLPAIACFADDRGDLVAKFDWTAVKAIIAPPEALFTLTGQTVDGETFSGSETIRVK